ncbi:MAG: insulinase family protein [Desulfovibrio sp.]|uniref:insulinase family protein n=1 Tax=Desulfovibrio sp. 7SRBS1 TaxID=3378064 RepID=UPI003B3F1500
MTFTTHGFELVSSENVQELRAEARLYRHVKTGARLLSMVCDDENKVFGISFRTPPKDSTGVAHILEHSVLCGSRKYPVKEPFVELLKGSLQTFLNAFTFPDKTCYPVASANVQDFYNLIDVYFDAVFHPRINEHVLKQEGWHYETENEDGPLSYKGVVFNEMKGVYSSPDSVLGERSQQVVFPDNTYGLDSGGNPANIPDLTFEQFKAFHTRFYHPANSWIYFWGDDDPEKRLELVDGYLSEFSALEVDSTVHLQPRLNEPRTVHDSFVAEDNAKSMVTINWLLPETVEADANLRLQVLDEILLGMPSSPLRKALIDSGLGEDITGGLECDLRQLFYSAGLKGLDAANVDEVQPLILDELAAIAEKGVDKDMIEAALNSIEFDLREMNTGRFPRGLELMVKSLTTWLYDADPLALLRYEKPLAALKSDLEAGVPVFEDLIREHFLNNPHRVTLILEPDKELLKRREDAEKERLRKVFDNMSDAERREVAEEAAMLDEMQSRPDDPGDLARIPRLGVEDLPRENQTIPARDQAAGPVEALVHDLPAAGIVYADLGFDMRVLPAELLPWVNLFGRALLETGTDTLDFVTLDRRIAAKTGGIDTQAFQSSICESDDVAAWFFVRAKSTRDKVEDMAAILQDVLLHANLGNRDRFRQMVLEEKARAEQQVIPSGHMFVASRLGARFTPAGFASERINGVDNLFFLRDLAKQIDTDWDAVQAKLESIRDLLVNRNRMLLNVTAEDADINSALPVLGDLAAGLPASDSPIQTWTPFVYSTCEGLAIPAQVNYVGKAVNLKANGISLNGSAMVVSRYLRTAYLWERVRVRGGAYGAFTMYDDISGVFRMISYRDPNLQRTLDAYNGAADYLASLDLHADELAKAIVGSTGDMDKYQLPDAKGYTSLARKLTNRTEASLQTMREQIMATTASDFRDFAEACRCLAEKGEVCVLGSKDGFTDGMKVLEVM